MVPCLSDAKGVVWFFSFFLFILPGSNRASHSNETIPMDDVYYVVPGPEDQADGQEPKVYVSTTQGLKNIERRHSNNRDRYPFETVS